MFNVGPLDRILRIIIGAWGWIGLLPLVTGLIGSCPAYMGGGPSLMYAAQAVSAFEELGRL